LTITIKPDLDKI